MIWKILAIGILLFFYAVYLGKMLLQRKKGIRTDQIAKGKQGKTYIVEGLMKIATYGVVAAEVVAILLYDPTPMPFLSVPGVILGIAGDFVFLISVITMRDSWRAGIPEKDRTELVTGGIYQISRNPAFLGFDLVYLGILLLFFRWFLLILSLFAVLMLHLQILQEEKFLQTAFGREYLVYQSAVCRYIGRKQTNDKEGN